MRLSDLGTGGAFGGMRGGPAPPISFGGGTFSAPNPNPVLRARPIIGTQGASPVLGARPRMPIIGSYKKGTKRVKKTGAYILHKDEAVLDKKKAQTMREKVKATMGKKAGC